MSAKLDLIHALRQYGFYPFIFAPVDVRPGAILDKFYLPMANIFDPEFTANGTQAFADLATAAGAARQVPLVVADLYSSVNFQNHSEVSLAYNDVNLSTYLDIGFQYSESLHLKPQNMSEIVYAGVDDFTLPDAFNRTIAPGAKASPALTQLIAKMQVHPDMVHPYKQYDIVQIVVVATSLSIEFRTNTTLGVALHASLQEAASKSGSFTFGGKVDNKSESIVSATWTSPVDRPAPVLWVPWRYWWDGQKFITGR